MAEARHDTQLDCSIWHDRLVDLATAPSPSPYDEGHRFLDAASLLADRLPQGLRRALQDFRLYGNRDGVLLLRGLPTDPVLPQTPRDNRPSGKISFISELLLGMFGAKLGEVIGYAQEKHGALIHDITPSRGQEREQSSEGSRVQLEMHTERCFHPHLPSHVLLYCLRSDHSREAATFYAGIEAIRPYLSSNDLQALFEPQFRTGIDYSFGNLATAKANGPVMSVLYGNRSEPFIRYDLDLMEGLNNRARRALSRLHDAIRASTRQVCLEAGDLLVIDNRRAVHGRRPFSARYDGRDRWLQRVYVIGDLAASAADRALRSRVINTTFEQYLDTVAAG